MNPLKSVLAGITLFSTAAAFAAPSDESTIIRITGSTAFRSQAHSAIVASFDAPPVAAYSSGSLSGAGQTFFYGNIGGQKYIITCSWAGSVGGIQTVTGGLSVNFLPDTAADSTPLAAAGAGATGGTAIGAGTNSKIPDVAMSDTYQSATPFKTPLLTDTLVGVVGFKWVTNRGVNIINTSVTTTAASGTVTVPDTTGLTVGMTVKSTNIPQTLRISAITGTTVTLTGTTAAINAVLAGTVSTSFVTPSPITNINTQQAQALYTNGTASLAQFTGNTADTAVKVYATGRDPDSGTRLSAFAETRVGVNATVTQYKVTSSNGAVNNTAGGIVPFPGGILNGITYATGNMGEASGGTLAGYFGNTSENANGTGPAYLIGYVGASDATTAINAGGKELTYNGVAYSDAAIKEGFYTFWCYEHVMYPATWNAAATTSVEGKKKIVIDNYALKIRNEFAPIKISEMQCLRTADGGVVFHN